MPIKIDNALPARSALESENIFVMSEDRAVTQDIRPLRILILNLMPTKEVTETQLLRLLSNSPLQVEVELLQVQSHKSKNTSQEHLFKFYKTFDEIENERFDGMIVTGAPVEKMAFEEVDYWQELCRIFDWSAKNVYSTLHICWGAQAGLYHRYNVPKYTLEHKVFGVYEHMPLDLYHPLLRGIDEAFWSPHSRNTEIRFEDIARVKDLQILAYSKKAGIHIISDMACRNFYIFGHCEYDADTLDREYKRDKAKGLDILPPENYYPNDDESQTPVIRWRGTGSLIYQNWLNYFVYQRTPYDLANL